MSILNGVRHMPKLNLTQAAKAAGISRASIYNHIKEGKISVEQNKKGERVIDTSELMRVYGDLKISKTHKASKKKTVKVFNTEIIRTLRQRVGGLEMQIRDLRKDKEDLQRDKEASRGREGELLGIIKQQSQALISPPQPPKKQGFFKRVFG